MEGEKTLSPEILEEFFSEVDGFDDLHLKEQENSTKELGFLEEIVNLEKELVSGKRKSTREKNRVQQSVCSKDIQKQESLIHEGLTDSSEDEDNKYFEESKYNECGRNLKNLLKEKTTEKQDSIKSSRTEDLWSKSKSAREQLKEVEKSSGNASTNSNLRDPVLGMNIINPLVSSAALKEKLTGKVFISTSKLRNFLETPAHKYCNWVMGGALVNKLTKTSQKGNQYCVWRVTDLSGDIKTVCVLLFGSAYKEHWKTSIGTVVGILNPTVMESNEKWEATLRVDNAQRILVIGSSKDYGLCKSKKKNGENCLSVVNKSKCDYCVFHMQKEYNNACRRSDLQPPKIGRSLDNLRAKVLGKNQVFYGGKTFTGVVGQKSLSQIKKDGDRMKLLSQKPPALSDWRKQRDEEILKRLNQKPLSLSDWQKQRDEDILKRLNQKPEEVRARNKDFPTLPKPEHNMIDLNFTVSKKERIAAKINALKYIRKHGPLTTVTVADKTKRTPEQIAALKRKLEVEEEEEEGKKVKKANDTPANPLKEKHLKNGITDEFLKLMNSKNRNNDLLKMAESEEREKYFNKLEMREKIENKMTTTFKVECKAVRCLKCNYKTFSASELCKKEKHPLKVVNAVKRFWKCGNCSARTVCLELVPLHSCKNCGSPNWQRTSMMPERKDSNIIKVPLSLRGDEEAYTGTTTKQANLNLLVPEEAP